MAVASEERINLLSEISDIFPNSRIKFTSSTKQKRSNYTQKRRGIKVWVIDKFSSHGPLRLTIDQGFTLSEMKQYAASNFGVALPLQRWVLRKRLCSDDAAMLCDIAGPNLNVPFYLYLVQTEITELQTALTDTVTFTSESIQSARDVSYFKYNRRGGNKRRYKPKQIRVWIEDKSSTQGPVHLIARHEARLGALMVFAKNIFGVAIPLQRWVVQNKVFTTATSLLSDLAGNNLDAPFCLYVVQAVNEISEPEIKQEKSFEIYIELMKLEDTTLVTNIEPFECEVCMEQVAVSEGVVLRDCAHMFCKECLSLAICHCIEPEVACLAQDCTESLQEREVRAIVSDEEYERWLARGLSAVESRSQNSFHCRTTNCQGWAICDPGLTEFVCPVCKHITCISCKDIHEGITCSDYKIRQDGTQAYLDDMLAQGKALKCPNSDCAAIIVKEIGCDWIQCSVCKTEICWATKGPRWGPAGKGDTSGGCRCQFNGKKCHPTCNYCH